MANALKPTNNWILGSPTILKKTSRNEKKYQNNLKNPIETYFRSNKIEINFKTFLLFQYFVLGLVLNAQAKCIQHKNENWSRKGNFREYLLSCNLRPAKAQASDLKLHWGTIRWLVQSHRSCQSIWFILSRQMADGLFFLLHFFLLCLFFYFFFNCEFCLYVWLVTNVFQCILHHLGKIEYQKLHKSVYKHVTE